MLVETLGTTVKSVREYDADSNVYDIYVHHNDLDICATVLSTLVNAIPFASSNSVDWNNWVEYDTNGVDIDATNISTTWILDTHTKAEFTRTFIDAIVELRKLK